MVQFGQGGRAATRNMQSDWTNVPVDRCPHLQLSPTGDHALRLRLWACNALPEGCGNVVMWCNVTDEGKVEWCKRGRLEAALREIKAGASFKARLTGQNRTSAVLVVSTPFCVTSVAIARRLTHVVRISAQQLFAEYPRTGTVPFAPDIGPGTELKGRAEVDLAHPDGAAIPDFVMDGFRRFLARTQPDPPLAAIGHVSCDGILGRVHVHDVQSALEEIGDEAHVAEIRGQVGEVGHNYPVVILVQDVIALIICVE